MLLPLWLFHWIFWADESLVLFPSTNKVREKAEYLICSLASNFWPVTNIRKTWTWEFVLSLNSWNLNLKSKRVHLPRSWQKKPVYRPLEEKWRTKRLSCLLSHRKQKEVTEKSKGKKSSNQINKGERMNAEAWSVLAAQWRKSKSLQHLVFPGGLPSKY